MYLFKELWKEKRMPNRTFLEGQGLILKCDLKIFFKCLFIFEREREREKQREGDTESEAGSRL